MYDDGEIPPLKGTPVSVAGIILLALLAIAAGVTGAAWVIVEALG